MIRLGEFRTATKDKENKLLLRLSKYDSQDSYKELEIDIITEGAIYLREVGDDEL